MGKIAKRLASVAGILIIIVTISACDTFGGLDQQNVKAKLFHKVPVPENAEVIEGQSLGVPEGAWGAAYTVEMNIDDVEKWYDRQLKDAKSDFNKTPEKPKSEGYVIFNISGEDEQKQVVIIGDSRGGTNIQVSGGWAKREDL